MSIYKLSLISLLFLFIVLPSKVFSEQSQSNKLINSKSPYLLQHSKNPVNWYPWGEEAFREAEASEKPVFLSVGYSTCHWCHVMAEESFSDNEIAEILNEHFISIKVDREERPDIDAVYMEAVVHMTGSGGWPLSVFLTPDKKPFFGGTYFPPRAVPGRPGFREILLSIQRRWENERAILLDAGDKAYDAIRSAVLSRDAASEAYSVETFDRKIAEVWRKHDHQYGGFGRAPKFPRAHVYRFLLAYAANNNDRESVRRIETALERIADGGIRDQLGGGFHRYATDRFWHLPHFEKMLYDQALLSRLYTEAYQVTRRAYFEDITRSTLDYVLRDMRSVNGAFYSAEDADSLNLSGHKKEGAYYLWAYNEIISILGDTDAEIAAYYYGLKPDGNIVDDPHNDFQHLNILRRMNSFKDTAKPFGISVDKAEKVIETSNAALLKSRKSRNRPHRDEKILTDWNAMMISSLAYAGAVFNEEAYLKAAQDSAAFILKNMRVKGKLHHSYYQGETTSVAFLADYAYLVEALFELHSATSELGYLTTGLELLNEMIERHFDQEQGGFFMKSLTSEDGFIINPKNIYDGAYPSANAKALAVLHKAYQMTGDPKFREVLYQSAAYLQDEALQDPLQHSTSSMVLYFLLGDSKEVVLSYDEHTNVKLFTRLFYDAYLPNAVLIHRQKDSVSALMKYAPFIEQQRMIGESMTAYVCQDHQCHFPTTDIERFKELILT